MPDPSPKYKKRAITIPVLLVVFFQTMIVSIVIVAVPLSIVFQGTKDTNAKGTKTGRSTAYDLAVKIQNNEGEIAVANIQTLLSSVESVVTDVQYSMNTFVDTSNPQQILNNLAYIQSYQSYFKNLYYTSSQNGFIGLFTIANSNQVWVSLPLNSVNPNCAVCEFWKTMSPTDLALAAKSSNLSWAPWNIGKQIATGPYRSMSTPFVPVTRPWYVQAAKSLPTNISVQYTSPYLFLKGIPGISANVPVFDKSGSLQGVIATDIPFSDIQSNLVNYLQTPNAFMYVFTADGTLVGNTINETLVLPNGSLKTIYTMEHVVMLQVAKYIQSLVSQNQTLQSLASPATYFENNGYLFQLRMMDSAPFFFIVNGAPKTDYTLRIDEMFNSLQSTLDGTVGTVIELTAGIFVLVVVASCFLIYFGIAKPLKVWTDVMVQAADYDFDAIKNFKRRGNFISELNEIEVAFFEMIAKFATAISSNKAITQRSGAVVSKASSQNTVSASPDKSVA